MILLDTHAWLWLNGAVEKIPASTRAILAQPELPVFFSAASAWEIAVKFQAGRLEIPLPPDLYIPSRLEQTGIASLPIRQSHALRAGVLPPDPPRWRRIV